jgi:GAF domain-containing protein
VFAAILENAVHICDAKFGTLFLCEKGAVRLVAGHNVPEFLAARGSSSFQPAPGAALDLAIRTKRPFHSPDLAASSSYADRHPRTVEAVEIGGIRTVVAVPMLKDDEPIGVIAINRREVRPFNDKQIELVKNFAAQAVIAIENARLLNELRQRTADLTEALEQQGATTDVLQVISASPGELEPVFAAILQQAVRICEAKFGTLYRPEGDGLRLIASQDVPAAFAAAHGKAPIKPSPDGALAEAVRTRRTAHLSDLSATSSYSERRPVMVEAVELAGVRSVVAVPMLKDDALLGIIAIFRQEVRPFTDKQIGLLENFAAQAAIAIENARLLNELRRRTTELTEALEQQTARLRFFRSSVALQATSSQYLQPCWRRQSISARPHLAISTGGMEMLYNSLLRITHRLLMPSTAGNHRFEPIKITQSRE